VLEHRSRLAGLFAALAFAVAPAAFAGLGERTDSIARDHAALGGTALQVTSAASWDVHEIVTSEGSKIREYAAKDGTVFAVAWEGRMPDLHVLLASHYAEYQQATARHANRRVLSISTPGLVMSAMKLPRGFAGSAHVPALLPAGTNPEGLR
jgi:hypothetical protein